MKLIAGLGNPGRDYTENRHNTGFKCINLLAKKHGIDIKHTQCHSRLGKGNIEGIDVILAKPMTYVNNSGIAICNITQKYKIQLTDIIVVYDDLDLPPGKIRIRMGGTAGGHNGIKSIIKNIGNRDFCRVKIGIGRPSLYSKMEAPQSLVVDYVLNNFSDEEKIIINDSLIRAIEAIECIISDGIGIAMNRFN